MDTAKVGRSPLPDRAEHAVHQQSRRAQRADDEIAAEDLRRLSLRVRRRRLRRYPMAALDCQKAETGPAPNTHRRPGATHRQPALGMITPPTWAVTTFLTRGFAVQDFRGDISIVVRRWSAQRHHAFNATGSGDFGRLVADGNRQRLHARGLLGNAADPLASLQFAPDFIRGDAY